MFHYFFDSRVYAENLTVDVFKVECFLLGVAMVHFSEVSLPNREDIWKLLVEYGNHLESLPDKVRPEKVVYEMLLYDQFEFYYTYFANNTKFEQIHINTKIVYETCNANPDFGSYLKSIGQNPAV